MENSAQDYEIEDLKCLNCKLHTAHLETTKDSNLDKRGTLGFDTPGIVGGKILVRTNRSNFLKIQKFYIFLDIPV